MLSRTPIASSGATPFDLLVEENADYLRFSVSGDTSLERFRDLIACIASEVGRRGRRPVLVDLRKVAGRLSTREQQLLGELAAAGLPKATKVASVVPEGEVSRNSEAVAVRNGLLLRVFDSEAAALFWLLESAAR